MKINQGLIVNFSSNPLIIKMSDTKFANLFFLDVIINEVPVTLMFDTGATMTVLKESTANLIGAQATGNSLTAGGSAGNTKEVQTVLLSKLQIGENEILQKEVLIAPDEALNFGLDDEGNQFNAQGFLGWDLISFLNGQ